MDQDLEVDADELVPEVIAVSTRFTRPLNGDSPNPRLHIFATDARRYVRATANHYDVIVADNFHPARSGSGALYTLEHFAAVKARLSQAGLFCQWLPLHQLDLATLASITGTFLQVFPHGAALLANNGLDTPVIGLVGRRDDGRFDPTAVAQRLADGYIDIQGLRLTCLQAAWRLAEDLPAGTEVATAAFWAAEAGHRVAHTAVHVHGGVGIDMDHPVHRYFITAKQVEFELGGATAQLLTIGRELADSPA
jgi:spermidine synthase